MVAFVVTGPQRRNLLSWKVIQQPPRFPANLLGGRLRRSFKRRKRSHERIDGSNLPDTLRAKRRSHLTVLYRLLLGTTDRVLWQGRMPTIQSHARFCSRETASNFRVSLLKLILKS